MKKNKPSGNVKATLITFLIIAGFIGVEAIYIWIKEYLPDIQAAKEKTKIQYNSLQVLNYNADTIEFVFHNAQVKHEFDREWQKRNYGKSIQDMPITDNMHVLKYNGDTIKIKFDDARFQRQFEKQWRKYSDHKLNRTKQNVKKR
ncbi:MAG: hypothetical protein J6T57_03250 [Alphaproteobacteria bacterium]|nr:hypothetical protein [Alphaproteobacteria bacterium]